MRVGWKILALGALLFSSSLKADNAVVTQYVSISGTRLLARHFAFSKTLARLDAGQAVQVLGTHGNYYHVQSKGLTGWIPRLALQKKRPQIGYSSQASADTSSEEVAAATKGFNSDVEAEYKNQNPTLDYQQLDRLEAQTQYTDPLNQLKDFRQKGKLGEFSEADHE